MKTYIALRTQKQYSALTTETTSNSADNYPDLHTDQVSLHSTDTSTQHHEKPQSHFLQLKMPSASKTRLHVSC